MSQKIVKSSVLKKSESQIAATISSMMMNQPSVADLNRRRSDEHGLRANRSNHSSAHAAEDGAAQKPTSRHRPARNLVIGGGTLKESQSKGVGISIKRLSEIEQRSENINKIM